MGQRKKVNILFVCMGNICRSPTAEGVFRKLVSDAGRDAEFQVDSAGTIGYQRTLSDSTGTLSNFVHDRRQSIDRPGDQDRAP